MDTPTAATTRMAGADLRERTSGLDPLDWGTIGPRYERLEREDLTPERVADWILRWSDLKMVVWEGWTTVKARQERDLTDEAAQSALQRLIEGVLTPSEAADGALAAKLLAVPEWRPGPEHEQMLRRLRAAAGASAARNPKIVAEVAALVAEYGRIDAAVAVTVGGRELTGPELEEAGRDPDRGVRERAWRAEAGAWLRHRGELDALFLALLARRRAQARDAGLADYRTLHWREAGRLDYTPEDCTAFHDAVEAEVVPLAARRQEARRAALGVATLRPWDQKVDPRGAAPPRPFPAAAFEEGMAGVFTRVDPELGELFGRMRRGYLDLGWRPGKRGGGVERPFPVTGIPYGLVCADGTDEGVGTLLHEMGHALHDHLTMRHTTLQWHLEHPDEFSEVASYGLYHLAAPYLGSDLGGPLAPADAARSHARFVEGIITRDLPAFARGDAFQHWVYAHAPEDVRPEDLDAKWIELSDRFIPWIDWAGLGAERAAGWHRAWSLFTQPFYEIAYALALLGSLHVWRNARADRAGAWRRYRAALSLGNTRPLPELYAVAGAHLPFDRGVVRETVRSVESWLDGAAR